MRMNTIHSVPPVVCRQEKWDEDDLIARLSRVLDAAERAVRELDCESGLPQDALIAETAVLLLAASNVASYSAIGPRIMRVASLLLPHAHSLRILRAICLEPAAAFEHATAHICLKRLGYYDCDFDSMLDLAAAAQASDGRERTPHRMLEQEWLKQGWLYPEGMRRLRCGAHIANSALNRPIDLLQGSRGDIASLPHALMYMTDFNLFPRTLPRSRETLLAEAEGMLARCLEEQDYALAAEVLLAWPLTGASWSPAAAFAFRVLIRAEDAGDVLQPLLHNANEKAQAGEATRPSMFGMAMLYIASLNDQRMPPMRIPRSTVRMGTLSSVLDCVDFDETRTLWQDELDELDPDERESLADFLLSMALHREFGRRDFAAMQRLLEVGRSLALAGSPLTTQAAEMMARVAQIADLRMECEPEMRREISVCA
jgi:hypothetical protein